MSVKEQQLAEAAYAARTCNYPNASFKDLPQKMRADVELAMLAIELDPDNYQWIEPPARNDEKVVSLTLSLDGYQIKHMSDKIKNSHLHCLDAVASNGLALEVIPQPLINDEIILAAITNHPAATDLLTDENKNRKELLEKLYETLPTQTFILAFTLFNRNAREPLLHLFIPQYISETPTLLAKYKQFTDASHPIYHSPLANELYNELTQA